MGVFYLYADESGKFNRKSEYVSFCGFVGQDLEWWRIGQEWDNCRLAYSVPAIHMSYISDPDRDPSGQWAEVKRKWGASWDRRKQEMLIDFARIIQQAHVACVGCTVDAAHYGTMQETDYKRSMHNPLYLAFYNLVRNALDKLDWLPGGQLMSVIIDDDQESSENYYNLLAAMRKQFPAEVHKRIAALSFANDVAFPAIQAADMIAYESRTLMLARKLDSNIPPSSVYVLMTKNGLHEPTRYTPEFLDILNKDKDRV